MRPIAPDKGDPFTMTGRNNGGGNGPKPQFMPGQISDIAKNLQMGYGGNVDKMKAYLKGIYEPVGLGGGFNFAGGNHNGGGKNAPDVTKPGTDPNQPTDGGFIPTRPRNRMAPMAMNGAPMPMQMPMQMPQQGLLNAPMQQTQQQGLLGDIPPEVLQYLNMRR